MLPCTCSPGLQRCPDEPTEAQSLKSDLYGGQTAEFHVFHMYLDGTVDARQPLLRGVRQKGKIDFSKPIYAIIVAAINGSTRFSACFSRYVNSRARSQNVDGDFMMTS